VVDKDISALFGAFSPEFRSDVNIYKVLIRHYGFMLSPSSKIWRVLHEHFIQANKKRPASAGLFYSQLSIC